MIGKAEPPKMSGWKCDKSIVRLLPVMAALSVAISGQAIAQRTTSKEVVECYVQAQNLLEQDKTREALGIVRACLDKEGRTPDERAVLSRFAAQLEAELGNDAEAAELRRALGEEILTHQPTTSEAENYFFLGRLYMVEDPPDYEKAIENFRGYIALAEKPIPDAFYYLAQALAKAGRCDEAIPQVRKAIELSKERNDDYQRLLETCLSKRK